MTEQDLFCPRTKIHQFIVQFACRIPTRPQLSAGEKKTLENLLRDLDPEHFQLPESGPGKDPACLFQVLRQHAIGASVMTAPSFIFSRDSFSFYYPTRMMNQEIKGFDSILAKNLNLKIAGWTNRILDAVAGTCQRAGKIYLMALGPFEQSEKVTIFNKLCSAEMSEIGEFNFTFTHYRDIGGEIYNILNSVNFMAPDLVSKFFLQVRVDINNRNLRQRMEPPDVQKIWDLADGMILEHLGNILDIPKF